MPPTTSTYYAVSMGFPRMLKKFKLKESTKTPDRKIYKLVYFKID